MRETLKIFLKESLPEATDELLKKIGIDYLPIVNGVTFDQYFEQNDFSNQYVEEVKKCLAHIWNIGYIDDTTFQHNTVSSTSVNNKYESISIFACEIKTDANFTRSLAVNLTRAFNRVSCRSVNGHFDMPVIVFMKQGSLLSIATCEHSDRLDGAGDKLGKVTILRNINCEKLHPGHRQILERIANDISNCTTYEELHKKWFKSFNIDIISDRFFEGYKAIYEDIIEYITGKRMVKESNKWVEHIVHSPCEAIMSEFSIFQEPEKAVRDYVKRLMGRLVFIQFLQKKGWMGVPAGDSWECGDPDFLQKLYDNSDKQDTFVDDVLEPLFDDINTKRRGDLVTNPNVGVNIKVPYLNGGLFEPDEVDKATFPLPGRFIKRLLDFFASYNFTIDENAPDDVEVAVDPEMLGRIFENLLEDNKDKGAFYTPKEIVQYMCRESLIAYLQTGVKDNALKEAIRDFVTTHNKDVLHENYSGIIDQRLKDVKICDPAIGSGAFPMGLLKELFECRKALEGIGNGNASEIKKHIIQNNIYGVDIEKGAVDIARLRFWLSLVVDEETPHALPNMDFKIMQGNSLLEQYQGVDLSDLDYHKTKKKEVVTQISVFDSEVDLYRRQLTSKKEAYFNCEDHQRKIGLRKEIQTLVQKQIDALEYNVDLSGIDICGNSEFFLWHTWFSDVFEKGGFDIVIGNPPYIDSETMIKIMPKKRILYAQLFDCACGNWDMFIIFVELGLKLLKKKGIFSNIVPNKLIAAKYGIELRKLLSSKHVLEVRDYSRIDVFEAAAVYPITIVLRNQEEIGRSTFTIMDNRVDIKQSIDSESKNLSKILYWDVFFVDTPIFNLIIKINNNQPLKTLDVEVLGAATVADAYNIKGLIVDKKCDNEGFKFVNSGTIDPYQNYWGNKACRYIKDTYLYPIVPYSKLNNYSKERYKQAKSPKIIIASMTTRYEAYLDLQGENIAGKSTTIIIGKEETLVYLTAIINSKLSSYWLNVVFNSLKMSGGAINIGKNELQLLPIPSKMVEFKSYITEIMKLKQQNSSIDTTILEQKIDHLVYELYGLTNEEVKLINPKEKTIGDDADLFKA